MRYLPVRKPLASAEIADHAQAVLDAERLELGLVVRPVVEIVVRLQALVARQPRGLADRQRLAQPRRRDGWRRRSRAPCPRRSARRTRPASPRAASPGRRSAPSRGRCGRCAAAAASPRPRRGCGPAPGPCARRPCRRRPWSRSPPGRGSGGSASHSPMIASDSPPRWPGTQTEYISAVSMKSSPASSARSSSRNDVSSSAVQPNTLPPRQSGATRRSERPSCRLSMILSHRWRRVWPMRSRLASRESG